MSQPQEQHPVNRPASDLFCPFCNESIDSTMVYDYCPKCKGSFSFQKPKPRNPATLSPSSELQLPADRVTTINVDDIKPNSILVINIDVENPIQKMAVAPVFSKLLAPYAAKLREKGVTVMLMTLHENINLISEEEMNNAGWEKKGKSLIINPFSK